MIPLWEKAVAFGPWGRPPRCTSWVASRATSPGSWACRCSLLLGRSSYVCCGLPACCHDLQSFHRNFIIISNRVKRSLRPICPRLSMHWRMPPNIPVIIHWESDNPFWNAAEQMNIHYVGSEPLLFFGRPSRIGHQDSQHIDIHRKMPLTFGRKVSLQSTMISEVSISSAQHFTPVAVLPLTIPEVSIENLDESWIRRWFVEVLNTMLRFVLSKPCFRILFQTIVDYCWCRCFCDISWK